MACEHCEDQTGARACQPSPFGAILAQPRVTEALRKRHSRWQVALDNFAVMVFVGIVSSGLASRLRAELTGTPIDGRGLQKDHCYQSDDIRIDIRMVGCAGPHGGKAFSVITITAGPEGQYPGEDRIRGALFPSCGAELAAHTDEDIPLEAVVALLPS